MEQFAEASGLTKELLQQMERDSRPFWLTNFMNRRPCLVIILSCIFFFILGGVSYKLGYFDAST
jgi:hypothetical protein